MSCSYNTSYWFSWAVFFCQDVTDHCTLAGSADSHLYICRDHSTPPLLGSKHGMGSCGFRWSSCGVLARGTDCTNVHFARLIASVKKAGLDVHDTSLASGCADVLDYVVSQANSNCSGTRTRIARTRSIARTVSSRRRISFLALSNRVALSILDASFMFARIWYQWSHGQLFPQVSLQRLDSTMWRLAACGGFCEENSVLETRYILYAVRYAESRYPPGRLLILSDNFALVLALCKGRSGLVFLVVQVETSELNYSDKKRRFFDHDYDPSKSLLHLLAQRV